MDQSAQLSAAQRSKIRRNSQPKELAPDEEGGELNIVPFLDIIVNILIFVLATVAVTFTTTLTTTPPSGGSSAGVRSQSDQQALNLTVLIVSDGFILKTAGGNIAPGCEGPGPGVSIPKKGDDYDYEELNRCAAKLKNASDKFRDETQFYIAPNPGTDFQTIVKVADNVREDKKGQPLFTQLNFKVAL